MQKQTLLLNFYFILGGKCTQVSDDIHRLFSDVCAFIKRRWLPLCAAAVPFTPPFATVRISDATNGFDAFNAEGIGTEGREGFACGQ